MDAGAHSTESTQNNPPAERPGPGEPSDRDLVAKARDGDAAAFETLVNRHQRQIYRLALRMMGNESDAEEVLQETFLNAYEKLGEFRGDAAFNSWIYRIAANSALMRLRRRRRAPDTVALPEPGVTGPGDAPPAGPRFGDDGAYAEPPRSDWSLRADEALQNAQLGGAIERAVQKLPEDYRVVFLLKDVDGLSNEQISEALGLSVPAVKSRLHRARLALREQLGDFFSTR
jgi:RNA polymerase sigma-70 factor (ECF subfamily)